MRSGDKNCVVDIMTATETRDPRYNTPIYTFSEWKTGIFANAVNWRGREVEVDGQIVAESYIKFEFDYFDVVGIKDNMVIRHEDQDYDIKSILKDIATKEYIVVDTVTRPAGQERA